MTTAAKPEVEGFFDPRTGSIQYVVADPATKHCAVVDPVLDFDERSGATGTIKPDNAVMGIVFYRRIGLLMRGDRNRKRCRD